MNPLVLALMGAARHRQSRGFITTWLIEEIDKTITLPLRTGFTYDMVVDWGDGNTDTITAFDAVETTHTYATAGTKIVTITGTCQAWYFNNGGDKLKFRTVENWEDVGFTGLGLENAFFGCSNATSFGTAMPYYAVTSLLLTWYGCSSATSFPDVSALTSVNTLSETWRNCSSATSLPDVSALTSVNSLLGTWFDCSSATSFPDVSALTSVASIAYAWSGCSSAKSFPAVSTLTSVTNLRETWRDCSSATSFPDVSALTSVTNLLGTWRNCSSATSFPDVSALTSVNTLGETWLGCSSATSFPDVSALTSVNDLTSTWRSCGGCTTVPIPPAANTATSTALQTFSLIGSGMLGTVVEIWNAMQVSGFSDGNAKFHRNGAVNTKNGYRYNDLLIEWDGTSKWQIKDGATILYESTDDVATPDLVTTWAAVSGGATIGAVAVGDYPNITAYANCFTGATGLTNYADIPDAWKGL